MLIAEKIIQTVYTYICMYKLSVQFYPNQHESSPYSITILLGLLTGVLILFQYLRGIAVHQREVHILYVV